MKKVITTALVAFAIVACKQTDTSRGEMLTVSNDSIQFSEAEANTVAVAELYPADNNLPLKVLVAAQLHNDEVSPDQENIGWFGVFKDRDKYYIAPTKVSIKKFFDAISDSDEDDPSTWTGWEVSTVNIDTVKVLISGNPKLDEHEIDPVFITNTKIHPNQPKTFAYNGIDYTLYATGENVSSGTNVGEDVIHNYRLYLKAKKEGVEINQLLLAAPLAEGGEYDTLLSIMLAGDIDNDGVPDFIINTSNHYNVYRPTVYLSSFADNNELVKVIGLHRSVGC